MNSLVFRAAVSRVQQRHLCRQIPIASCSLLQARSHAGDRARGSRGYTTAAAGRSRQIAGTAGNVLLVGSVMTLFGYIMYTLYDNLLAENGVTRVYNDSLDLVRANPQIRDMFGPSVMGFGEPSHGQRQRQRAISHREFEDAKGRQRLTMKYYVMNKKERGDRMGVVRVDIAKSEFTGKWDYNYVVVDVFDTKDERNVGRIEVLVTDEFANEVRVTEQLRRNRRFDVGGRGGSDGSWFSALNPSNWRK
ncbi:mitochondrial import inner membrane translocase subunit tim21 [Coemansia interrupta]|uniref:Mitochondrial import inner membrane translocase subunit Tim21 n=1 Tax=Coemansia interrupta TaxID=1126814 RepID=A0A9W8HI63_9FUNG|nr:mitochondrial import inner membrane translocase subunit tim21 [Coemansia interrupta]